MAIGAQAHIVVSSVVGTTLFPTVIHLSTALYAKLPRAVLAGWCLGEMQVALDRHFVRHRLQALIVKLVD